MGITPERELRTFALDLLNVVKGADAERLQDLIGVVKRRIAGDASLGELADVQRRTRPFVTPAGVQGLPRLLPHAAGILAVWHTAWPNPYDAAFWTAEFAALHEAFVAVQEAAALVPSTTSGGWHATLFDRAYPQMGRSARIQARWAQAVRLRRILPQPFPEILSPIVPS